jgi:hypothetical protein
MPTLVSVGQITIADLNDSVQLVLSTPSVALPADSAGTVSSFSAATCTAKVILGGVDDTSNWTLSKADTSCTSTLTSGVVTVSAMSADSAYVDVTATRSGWASLTARFALSKSKAGAAGADSTTYWMSGTAGSIQKSAAGAYTPAGVTFKAFSAAGSAAPAAYGGRFIIATSADGTTYTDAYTGTVNESAHYYAIPAGIVSLRARLYLAGGTTTLVDEQTIPIVNDGSSGANATRTAVLEMYQWASSAPTTYPSGTSTWTWASGTFTAPATTNGWALTPGAAVAGQTLYMVRQVYSDALTAATSSVTWSATTSMQIGKAGANGANGVDGAAGANGVRTGVLEVYRWSDTAPTTYPSGTSTYTWASGVFTAPSTPNGWGLLPGTPIPGATLWAIQAIVTDSSTSATSTATWSSTSVYAIGSAPRGTNLIDSAWWAPGATFRWTKADALSSATSIDWQPGPKGQTGPVVKAVAGFTNNLVRAEANNALAHWADSGDATYSVSTKAIDSAAGVSGTSSIKLTKASIAVGAQGIVSRAIPVTAGQTYRIYLYAKGDTAASAGLQIVVNQCTSAPAGGFGTVQTRASTTTVQASGALTTSFVKYPTSYTYTVPAGVTHVSLQIKPLPTAPANIWIADPVMSLTSLTDSVVGPCEAYNGGGWLADANDRVVIDPTKTYRLIQPVYIADSGATTVYLGGDASTVCTLATTTAVASPVFASASLGTLAVGRWYLFSGTIFPAGSTYASSADSGVWDATTGAKVASGTSYCWAAATTSAGTRAFQAYGFQRSTVYLGQPTVAVVDGAEDPLKALLSDAAILNASQQWADVQAIPTASLGDCDSNSLGFNGAFLAWPAANALPTGWSTWTSAVTTRSTAVQRDANGGPSARMVCAGSDGGLVRSVNLTTPLPAGSLLWGSVDIYLESRTAGVPMQMVRLYTNAGLTTWTDTYITPATTTGSWQRLNFTARTPNLTDQVYGIAIYLIGSWTGTPGGAFTGTCYFANSFFEIVDKSIDNKSLQFSEVSGALTFTPSGNGTSSYTAVTATNKVTAATASTYVADLALGTAKLGDESVSLVRGQVGTYSASVTITLTAAADVFAIGTWTQGNFRENQTVGLYKDGTVYQAETPITGTLGAMQYSWSAVPAGSHNFAIAAYVNTGDMRCGITVIVRYK